MDMNQIDINENRLYRLDHELLAILLKDRSSCKNIIWATDNYAHKGAGFQRGVLNFPDANIYSDNFNVYAPV